MLKVGKVILKMDAPNVPNPVNPNAQGQNADAEPGPANQVQGPTVQNQAQGLAVQNPSSGSYRSKLRSRPCRSSSSSGSSTGSSKCACPTIITTGPYANWPLLAF